MTSSRDRTNLTLLLSLAGMLFFLGLGDVGLTDRDEGRNAEAGREMFETGDWISPTFNYEPRYAKPVLVYWLMSLSYRLFGVSEFAARFPSALFGVGLILLQYLFVTSARGPLVGLFAALMLLLNIEITSLARMALTDSALIFFTTISLFGFWLGLHGEGRTRHWMWAFYVGMALATLTKGPVGLLVPLLAALPYLALTKRWGQFWRTGVPLAGTALFLLLTLPWYLAMLHIHGEEYSRVAQAHTIGRFLSSMEGHGFTVLFYIPVLLFGFFPWSGFLPFALYQALKNWRVASGKRREDVADQPPSPSPIAPRPPAPEELEFFAALWLAAGFVFFTLSATRLPHYIGPLFPAAAILTASYWHRCMSDPATPGLRASLHILMALGYTLGIALASIPVLYEKFIDVILKEFPAAAHTAPGYGPAMAGLTLVVGCGMVGYFGFSDQRRAGAFWAAGATIAIVMLIAIQVVLPRLSFFFVSPPQQLAYAAGLNLGPEDRLILYGPSRPSLVFYAKRKAIVIGPGEEETMKPYLGQPGRTMILLPSQLQQQLPAEAANFQVILQRYGYSLLASQPMIKLPPGPPPGAIQDPHARYK